MLFVFASIDVPRLSLVVRGSYVCSFVRDDALKGNGDGKSFCCDDGSASLYTKLLRERERGRSSTWLG